MMGPGESYPGSHVHSVHHSVGLPTVGHHHSIPMDLHVPQGFPYYRYRNEPFCWPERKPGVDDMTGQGSMNPRQVFDQTGRFPQSGQTMPILELRKEKSRDAARSRRGKENYEFYELAKMLPLPPAITSQLDKASIIRLTISFLRLKDFSSHGDPPWVRENPNTSNNNKKGGNGTRGNRGSLGNATLDLFEQHIGTHILQSLDGFAFSLAADGRFLYISETVSIYLGLSQVEMTGSSVFDYIHQSDHAELAEQLGLGLAHGPGANVPSPSGSEDGSSNSATNNPDVSSLMSITSNLGYKGLDRAFCIRMKSTLTKRGCHFKSSGYRVVLVLCRLRPQYSFSHTRKSPTPLLGMVALAIALPPPSVHEIRLESDMFVTRLSFDFRILHCEPRVSELLDYTGEELMGKNLYALCHAEDVNKLRKCHVDLLGKGQVMSQYYRFMNKNGGWTWAQSCATVVCNTKNSDEQSIICVNYVISGKEYPHVVMDSCQLEQECQPTVKCEILDDREQKTPDKDSSDGGPNNTKTKDSNPMASTSSTTGIGLHQINSTTTRSPTRSSSSIPEPPTADHHRSTGESTGRERPRVSGSSSINQRGSTSSRISDEPVLESPISKSEILDARAGSRNAIDTSDQFGANKTPAKSNKGRKRKLDKTNKSAGIEDCDKSLGNPTKRQVIVQSESEASVTNHRGETTTIENSSPAHRESDTSEIGRWRKNSTTTHHQQSNHWDSSNIGTSSVKDLEQVMSKHLPGRGSDPGDHNSPVAAVSSGIVDFSTDSLLSRQPQGSSSSRTGSAIQWVGPGSQSTPAGLPVSALLRQLCASRESVIRANVQAAAAAVAAARSGSSYYPDMATVQSALPTPPGSDSYTSDSQFMLGSHQKSGQNDFVPSLVPYPSVSSYDYQPAMTPPSSVSPRDKPAYSVANGGSAGPESYINNVTETSSFRPPPSYLVDGPAQPLPLKPQVYGYHHPHSSLDPGHQYPNPLGDHHSQTHSQFYPGPPHHTGFHLYHPGKPTPYGDPLKNTNWYSTAS